MMSILPDSQIGCNYRLLPGDIHEFILFDASAATLIACFHHMEAALVRAPLDQPMLTLSDIQGGVPPTHVLWRLVRAMFAKYPRHPTLCSVVLYHEVGMLRALVVVIEQISRLYGTRVRFFPHTEREKAIVWLLEQRAKKPTGELKPPT